MDVILHLGAHRCATTTFQRYMRQSAEALSRQRCGFWGPARTRPGLFNGLNDFPPDPRAARRARGRIALWLSQSKTLGVENLVISDENMIGTPRGNLRCAVLYPEIGTRIARLSEAFGGRIDRVALQIRALDSYWASVLAFAVSRGAVRPDPLLYDRLATNTRSWRDVTTELSCALPGIPIVVTSFEQMAGRPERLLQTMHAVDAPPAPTRDLWINRAPELSHLRRYLEQRNDPSRFGLPEGDGRWKMFTAAQAQALRARHAADLTWLRAGADGLAGFVEDTFPEKTPKMGFTGDYSRGSDEHDDKRRLARPG